MTMRQALLIASLLGATCAVLAPEARAFEIRFHKQMNDTGLSGDRGRFLRLHVAAEMRHMHDDIDNGAEAGYDERHFDDCEFNGGAKYIRDRFAQAARRLGKSSAIWSAPDSFGRGLHPTQDFYAHSNWVEMGFPRSDLSNTPDVEVKLSDLVDLSGVQESIFRRWFAPGFGRVVRGDILLGADDGGIIPRTWSVDRDGGGRHVPTLVDAEGRVLGRLLVSGMSTTDHECNVYWKQGDPRTRKFKGFSHDALNKDSRSNPLHRRARAMATLQTSYEWCRLVREAGVAKTDGVLLTTWIKNFSSPHPAGTPCAARAPGPKEVTVNVESVRVLNNGDGSGRGQVQLAAALYDDPVDFTHSIHRTTRPIGIRDRAPVPSDHLPPPMSLCVDADDGAVFALHGWDNDQNRKDHKSDRADFDDHGDNDDLLLGSQRQIVRPGLTAPASDLIATRSKDLEIVYRVTVRGTGSSCPQPPPPPPPTATKPDLVISDLKVDEFTVKNQGTGAAGPFTVTIVGFDEFRIPGLAVGATARITYPGNCEAEHRAIADSGSEIAESNESNNVTTFTTIC